MWELLTNAWLTKCSQLHQQHHEGLHRDMIVKSLKEQDHLCQAFVVLRRCGMKLNPTKCCFGVTSSKFLGYRVTRRGIEADPQQIKAVENIQSPNASRMFRSSSDGLLLSTNSFRSTPTSLTYFSTPLRKENLSSGIRNARPLSQNLNYTSPLHLCFQSHFHVNVY